VLYRTRPQARNGRRESEVHLIDVGNVSPFGDDKGAKFSVSPVHAYLERQRSEELVLNPLAANLAELAASHSAKPPDHVKMVRRMSSFLLNNGADEEGPEYTLGASEAASRDFEEDVEMQIARTNLGGANTRRQRANGFAPENSVIYEEEGGIAETNVDRAQQKSEEPVRVYRVDVPNVRAIPPFSYPTAVKASELRDHVAALKASGAMQREFELVVEESSKFKGTTDVALEEGNKHLNRYRNILPYDYNRCKLDVARGVPDFINASWIFGYNGPHEFIATQGPLPYTVDQFWQLVWQENARAIAAMTQLMEEGRPKCHAYWPLRINEELFCGPLSIVLMSEEEEDGWVVRSFAVQNSATGEERVVRQYHITQWPDHGVPVSPQIFVRYLIAIRKDRDANPACGPLVIHCSAGVGRTGMVALLSICIESVWDTGYVDVPQTLIKLREQRTTMVQASRQYEFVYDSLVYLYDVWTGRSVGKGDGVILEWLSQRTERRLSMSASLLSHRRKAGDYIEVTPGEQGE
jgi:protein tyrosine phosphatase